MLTSIPLFASAATALLIPSFNNLNPFQSPLLSSPKPFQDNDESLTVTENSWIQHHLESIKDTVSTNLEDSWDSFAAGINELETTVTDKLDQLEASFRSQLDAVVEKLEKPHKGHHGKKGHHGHHGGNDFSNLTIYELIHKSNYTTRFAALVDEHPDIVSILNSTKTNHTLFVPINKAFERIPDDHKKPGKDFLEAVLKYHISGNSYSVKEVVHSFTLPTLYEESFLNGPQRLRVSAGLSGVKLNFYSKVVAGNFEAENGVVHAIDHILIPPPFTGRVISLFPSLFSTHLLATGKTDFVKYIHGLKSSGWTTFVPSNKAYARLGPKVNAFLFNTEKGSKYLSAILKYHVVPNATLYTDAFYDGTKEKTEEDDTAAVDGVSQHYELKTLLGGASVGVDIGKFFVFTSFKVNGFSHVVIKDGVAKNGVIQVLDHVLIPPHKHNHGDAFEGESLENLTVQELTARLDSYLDAE